MKCCRTILIFNKGGIAESTDWASMHASYRRSIGAIHHPVNSGSLTLRRKVKREDGQWDRNGVGYLRSAFLAHMKAVERWQSEVAFTVHTPEQVEPMLLYPEMTPYREPVTSEFGGFDFVTTGPGGSKIAIEWETGNISSSHRSMNKLAIALAAGQITAGVLILPSRELYEHLTDRIGNIGELSGYLPMWHDLKAVVERGLLAVTVVEHDHLTDDIAHPFLKSGGDGRAREGRTKRLNAARRAETKASASVRALKKRGPPRKAD